MLGSITHKGTFHQPRITETAGTAIVSTIPPAMRGAKTRLTFLEYVCSTTAHTLRLMVALNRVSTTAAAAASATSLVLSAATFRGDTLASGDYIVVKHTDGTYGAYLVSALSVLTVTIPALAKAVASGNPVWIMGAIGEAEHKQILVTASVRQQWSAPTGLMTTGYRTVVAGTTYARSGNDDPMIVYSNNATAAGLLENASGYYGSP
jgi:hypothetical protein